MDIYLNRQLLSDNFLIGYQTPDGNVTMEKFKDHCYYHGALSGNPNTSVVLSTCNGLRGTIQDENGKTFGIEPRLFQDKEHIFYDIEDVPKRVSKCGVEHDHSFDFKNIFSEHVRRRRSLEDETKYIALALVNDKRQYEKYNNVSQAVARALEIGNHVDQLVKTIKARAAVVYVETWNIMDLAHISTPASTTLGQMRAYNKDVLVHKLLKQNIRRDNVQLISGIDFDGQVVGMAGIGTICGLSSTGVNMDFTSNAGITAGTVAHELGHNLGMAHDVHGCACNGGPCVMAAVGGGVPVGFTQCSKRDMDRRVKEGLASCLFDVPQKLFGPAVCGNDFLEAGEECDCGSVAECIANNGSACCNATTCKLHAHAQCAVGACCKDCKFVQQGVLCRKRETECDFEEVCNGASHECPANFYKEDGTPCRNSTAYCFEGGCRAHQEQCERLWGIGAIKAHYVCFTENMAGTQWSNCGKNSLNQYEKCDAQDILCGTVQCANTPNRFPILGTGDLARFRGVTVLYEGKYIYVNCKQGVTSLGPDLDNPTLTQQGTKCGEGKLCINRKCKNMTSLDFIKPCPADKCFNKGTCNNMGNCHCPPGFACPDCKHPGPGGSINSGHKCYVAPAPATGLSTLAKSLLIIFLGVVPVIVVSLFLLYRYRTSLPCKPSSSTSTPHTQQPKGTPSRSNEKPIGTAPSVGYKPGSSQPPQWIQKENPAVSNAPMSFSNVNAYSSYPKPSATPSRAPPPPPPTLIYSKIPELTPSAPPPPNPNLRPVQQRNPPPPNSKPARLPPMLPTKPK